MQLRRLAFGVVGSACCGASASAQMLPAVSSERQFHANASVATIYDNNFARSSRALAAQRGISMRETTLRPQVTVDVVQPLGRQLVYLKGGAGYDFHRENNQLDSARGDVQGGYVTTLGFCQASTFGNFSVAQSDLSTLDSPGVKNVGKVTAFAVGAQCGRARGFTGGVTAQRAEVKNSARVQTIADSTVETLSTQVGYANPNLGRFSLAYNYSNNELPNQIIPGRPIGDGFFTQTLGVAVERQFGSRIKTTATVGQTTVKREFAPAGADLKFTSLTYAGTVNYRLGGRLTLDLSADRAVVPTARAGKLYDITTKGQLRGTYRLGSRYIVSLGGGVVDVKSNPDTAIRRPVVSQARTKSVSTSVRYAQNQRTSLVLDVRYDDRNTNLPEFNYTSTRVGLTAQVGF